ncbi:MAG: ECF-type sigma factor [Vicinamibacterales bacterium]
MSDSERPPLTHLLQQWSLGDSEAFERLVAEVYPELRAMAGRHFDGSRSGTIQATTLVHDLYLRLLRQGRASFPNRRAFFGFAAEAMRHILIDHIRSRDAQKRGARRVRVPLTEDLQLEDPTSASLLDLDRALDELAAFDPRKAELVRLCAFLGCGRAEAAELLDISLATAKRDLRVARAWLSHRLQIEPSPEG